MFYFCRMSQQAQGVSVGRTIPGPRRWPVVGSGLSVLRHGIFPVMQRGWQRYGDTFRVDIGPKRMVVIIHPDDAEKVLISDRDNFYKGPSYDFFRVLVGDGMVTNEGEMWRARRRVAQPSFNKGTVTALAGKMTAATEVMLASWAPKLQVGTEFDIYEELLALTMWIIGDTLSGSGATQQVHILVKPTRTDLMTNLVINTDRRTYHMELRSTEKTYMASVSWQYPQDQLIALRRQNAQAALTQPVASGVDISKLNFRYAIEGDSAPWRPLRAFDDGNKVYIEFPSGIGQGEMPPLFVIGSSGNSELVNYRARQNYYVVDRLFAAAELRLGDKDSEKRVRIVRTDGRPGRSARLF